jgi:hypothetical protein
MALYLGRRYDEKSRRLLEQIRYTGERYMILFGPNGSGKGTRFLLPNLLGDHLRGQSLVVIDPKGESAAVSAGARHWMTRAADAERGWLGKRYLIGGGVSGHVEPSGCIDNQVSTSFCLSLPH